jgi:hypothetical protein
MHGQQNIKFQPVVLQQILVSEDCFPSLTDYPLVSPTEDQMQLFRSVRIQKILHQIFMRLCMDE